MRWIVPLLALVVGLSPAVAEEPADAPDAQEAKPAPKLATDAQAKAALESFKEAFKARGLKGDERLMQREFAMRALSKVQHRAVVDALAKVTKNRSPELRTAAVTHLGKQTLLPGYAGHQVLRAMGKWKKDDTFSMACLAAITSLKCLIADDVLRPLLAHKDYGLRKEALLTIGRLKDVRLLPEVFELAKALKIGSGSSWEGGEASVDTGTAGSGDQKAAEAKAKAEAKANKQAGRRGAGAQRDIGPVVLETLKLLTGEEFTDADMAKAWMDEQAASLAAQKEALAERAKAQTAELKKK